MITFDRKALSDELSLLSSVLDVKTTIPVLAYVKVEAGQGSAVLTASNADAAITSEISCEGEFQGCLPLRTLAQLVRLFEDNEVKIRIDGSRAEVKNGRSVNRLPLMDTVVFPKIEPVAGQLLTVNTGVLSGAIKHVLPCADKLQGKYATQGVCFDASEGELNAVTWDGTQAGIAKIAETDLKFSFVVPNQCLGALQAILMGGETVITIGDTVSLRCGLRSFTSRILAGQFPSWRMILPKDYEHRLSASESIAAAVKRGLVTASAGSLVRKRLIIDFGRESLVVRTYESEGESTEEVAVGCPSLNGDRLSMKVNAEQFLLALETLPDAEFSFRDNKSVVMFTEGDKKYLQAPLRLDA